MPEYLTPGVYIEELDTGSRPVEQVGMSVPGFVGVAPKAAARTNEAVRITSFGDFSRIFIDTAREATPLAYAVQGFFLNGGSACYVVNLGDAGPISGGGRGLDALEPIDEIAMYAAPGYTDADSQERLLSAAERYGSCLALLDGPERIDELEPLTRVAMPDEAAPKTGQPPGLRARVSPRGHGALYVPWLRVPEMFPPSPAMRPRMVSVPPSGHVAGLYARNDFERGVHKAPANMVVRGVTGLSRLVGKADQALLNPAGVNCFRWFSTEGVLLWGARTLASDPQWRYVNVRRLLIMIERSLERNLQHFVFQPNDHRLWRTIRRDIGAFLTLLWRQNYLMGTTPEQAFFVKCDEETNPPEVVDAGRVETLIGVAPVKPAEFVIFRIGQSQAGATSFEIA